MFRSLAAASALFTLAAAQLDAGISSQDLDPSILDGGNIVNLGAFSVILDPTECAVGLTVGSSIPLLAPTAGQTCQCVNPNGGVLPGFIAIAACAACDDLNSVEICATGGVNGGSCGCACLPGFFAVRPTPRYRSSNVWLTALLRLQDSDTNTCLPVDGCAPGNVVTDVVGTGQSACRLAPSGTLNRVRAKKSLLANVDLCPSSETACPLPSCGYECLDITSSLDSCGGCLGQGGVNCLSIPGALGVSCADSQCAVSSCFPDWSFQNGACVRV